MNKELSYPVYVFEDEISPEDIVFWEDWFVNVFFDKSLKKGAQMCYSAIVVANAFIDIAAENGFF